MSHDVTVYKVIYMIVTDISCPMIITKAVHEVIYVANYNVHMTSHSVVIAQYTANNSIR